MKLNYKSVLDNKPYLKEELSVPSDLKSKIDALEKVLRFQFKEYPTGVIIDNTKIHTLRCVLLARSLGLETKYPDLLRILWIHDIPEIETNDVTVIEKEREARTEKKFEKSELLAAQNLLNKDDQKLLYTFNSANNFLKGKSYTVAPLCFLFAKIIDNSEGNMTFHYFISKWAKSKSYKKELLPPIDSLIHTFKTNAMFKKRVKQALPPKDSQEIVELIETVINEIKSFWIDVPKDRIPVVITDAIKDYESKH